MVDGRQDWEGWHDHPPWPTWVRPVLLAVVGVVAVVAALAWFRVFDGGARAVSTDGVTIHVQTRALLFAEGFPDAALSGVLTVEGGCVGLGDDAGMVRPVVWPRGTSIASTDPMTLTFASGAEATVGATIIGAGVEVSPDEVDADIAPRCLADDLPATFEGPGGVLLFNRTQPDGLDVLP